MPLATPTSRKAVAPKPRRWTREEFDRAEELGLFKPEERLELIAGAILKKETFVNTPRAITQRKIEKRLNAVFARGHDVRGQLPLALGDASEPMLDVAVVVGTEDDYLAEHPTTAVLVVEISDTTLRFDRATKAPLYAQAGIPEYWIINLNARVLEAHRQPMPRRGKPLAYHYAEVKTYAETDALAPLAAPDSTIAVADLLPRLPA